MNQQQPPHRFLSSRSFIVLAIGLALCLGILLTGLYWRQQPAAMGDAEDIPTQLAYQPASSEWYDNALAEISEAEYEISPVGEEAVYQAPNRVHGFRTWFADDGVQLQSRLPQDEGWSWGLQLTAYGYAGQLTPVTNSVQVVDGNRIEYQRENLTEWYVNGAMGLEQGFTIHQPPLNNQSEPQNNQLILDLAVAGNLLPELVDDNTAIDFKMVDGARVLYYSDLVVLDANERTLPATMQLAGCEAEMTTAASCQIQLVINDSQAQYPLVVDPLLTTPDWTAESDQQTALLGAAVARAGDVNGDGYDDVIVGAYGYDNGQTNEGRVFVYYGSATGLSTTADWTAESDQAYASFGISVNSAGDVNGDGYDDVMIGATGYDNGQMDEGRVFVFHGSAAGLSTTADWTAEGDQVLAYFGSAVSTAGDVNGDGYDDILVGASQYYNNFDLFEGWAFVYHGSASGLNTTAAWSAEGGQMYAYFGSAVSTAGDVNNDGYDDIIVGAYGYSNGQSGEGRTFVYHGSATGLSAASTWTAESDQAGASFGIAVDTAGDVNGDGYDDVVIGATGYDNNQTDEGRAYVYHGSASGLNTTAAWTAESDQASAQMGNAVGTAGDVNGDGYDDVIIGAYFYDNGQTDEGLAYAFYGSASGLSASADWTVESDQASANFGTSLGTAGDVNGDGTDDVIVGSPFYDNGESDEGRAYVFLGSGSGMTAPIADFSASPLTGTVPLTVTFSNLSQNSDSYLWQFGDGITSTLTTPAHNYGQTGIYTVTLTAYGSGGSPDTLTRTNYITVTAAPVVANFSAAPLSGSFPLTVTFTNASSGATDYIWQFGDGATSTETNPIHTYTQNGVYTVVLTATNNVGVSDTYVEPDYITVTSPPPPNWQQITTSNTPDVNGEYSMVYDSNRDVVVLYGGNGSGWPYSNETWEFDGSDWSQITTAQNPNAVYGMRMTYDSNRNVTVLFGGNDTNDAR